MSANANSNSTSSSGTATAGTGASNDATKPKIDLGLLEEDDEFEEFPAEDGNEAGNLDADDDEVKVWEDNWDDDNIEDDFSEQLRKELEAVKKK